MSRYRSPGGNQASSQARESTTPVRRAGRGGTGVLTPPQPPEPEPPFAPAERTADEQRTKNGRTVRAPSTVWRGRIVVAAVAAGAFAAAGQSLAAQEGHAASSHDEIDPNGVAASFGTTAGPASDGDDGARPEPAAKVLPAAQQEPDSDAEVDKLTKSQHIAEERAAAEAEAQRPKFVQPADGYFTSGFGGRWGNTHYGIDIANEKGTPIVSAADGVVIEAGPASGFGMWVRVQHDDGSITVYGHVDSALAEEGQQVQAGDEIATIGDRGFSTGPHLHFEVWNPAGKKINPLPWLQEHGIDLL